MSAHSFSFDPLTHNNKGLEKKLQYVNETEKTEAYEQSQCTTDLSDKVWELSLGYLRHLRVFQVLVIDKHLKRVVLQFEIVVVMINLKI